MHSPIIIAHRGASGTCPENTLLAFRTAIESGAKWLELDVHRVETELVVFHDDDVERTTNGAGLLTNISLTELRGLDAGRGEQVPLLQEVLSLAAGRAQVNIELKGVGTGGATAKLLAELFRQSKLAPADVLASSLRLEELNVFHKLMPQVRIAPILEKLPDDLRADLEAFAYWSLHVHKSLITRRFVELSEQYKCKVFAWTVNDIAEAEQLFKLGVSGIFTDYPEKFMIRKN